MIAMIFSIVLFFVSVYFLFKSALITSVVVMGFSIIWSIIGYLYHRYDRMYEYISHKNSTDISQEKQLL